MRVFCDCIVYPEGCPGVKGVTGRSLGRAKLKKFPKWVKFIFAYCGMFL